MMGLWKKWQKSPRSPRPHPVAGQILRTGLASVLMWRVVQISAETRNPYCTQSPGKKASVCSEVMCCLLFSTSLFPASLLPSIRLLRISGGARHLLCLALSVTSSSGHGLMVDSVRANPSWPCGLCTVPHAATERQCKSVTLLLLFWCPLWL